MIFSEELTTEVILSPVNADTIYSTRNGVGFKVPAAYLSSKAVVVQTVLVECPRINHTVAVTE